MHILRARQGSTGQWFHRIDAGTDASLDEFRASVAAQFGVAVTDVTPIVTDGDEATRAALHAQLIAGAVDGVGVIAPKAPAPVAAASFFELQMLGIFGDALQRNALLKSYPIFLFALRGGDYAAVQVYIADALATGVISQAQYDAVKAAAAKASLPLTL